MKTFGELKKGDKIYFVEKTTNKKGEKVNILFGTVTSVEIVRSVFGNCAITLDENIDDTNTIYTLSHDAVDLKEISRGKFDIFSDSILMKRFLQFEYGYCGTTNIRNKFNKIMRESGDKKIRWNLPH